LFVEFVKFVAMLLKSSHEFHEFSRKWVEFVAKKIACKQRE